MELFETMLQHTSVRSFTQQKLTDELREQLILSAQSASSSNFLQAFSIIEITDAKKTTGEFILRWTFCMINLLIEDH